MSGSDRDIILDDLGREQNKVKPILGAANVFPTRYAFRTALKVDASQFRAHIQGLLCDTGHGPNELGTWAVHAMCSN